MEIETLADRVLRVLQEAAPSTVVAVHEDGGISVQQPGRSDIAGADRRRGLIATFVASRQPARLADVATRLRKGLYKRSYDERPVAIRR